ncbi:MAG TPA: ParB/RepB/Spo0J family partition protein [Thermoanaerobaculia bacterium]|nr:ParB/RepB/Spo0J family partition protein [Thermoanaerobaculia bacterium]
MRHDAHFVEQLVRADELPVGRRIPIHLIEANPNQPRTAMGDLEELTRSIASRGVLEPILVRAREDGHYTIISGERRYRAALEAGLAEIPCIEMEVTDSELLEVALVENLQRKDLTPFEEADGYRALKERYGYTHEQISEAVGKSRVTVTEALAIGRLPEAVKEECRHADIVSKSFLLELGRLRSEELMLDALRAWTEGGDITRDSLRDTKKESRGSGKGKPGALRKTYAFDFIPEDRRYKVSLVFLGKGQKKDDVLAAIREIARRIEAGEIDLEKGGRFLKPKKSPKRRGSGDSPEE